MTVPQTALVCHGLASSKESRLGDEKDVSLPSLAPQADNGAVAV